VASTTLKLTYDYGSTSNFSITFTGSEHAAAVNMDDFPHPVAGFVEFVPPAGIISLDETFPIFSKWAFGEKASGVRLNLFKAGRKQNFGFQERGTHGVRHMIYFPESFDTLQDYLHVLEYAARLKYKHLVERRVLAIIGIPLLPYHIVPMTR
jgi:hypothetical protein